MVGGSGTGIYYVDVDLDQIGVHTVKVASTDVVIASETVEFSILAILLPGTQAQTGVIPRADVARSCI